MGNDPDKSHGNIWNRPWDTTEEDCIVFKHPVRVDTYVAGLCDYTYLLVSAFIDKSSRELYITANQLKSRIVGHRHLYRLHCSVQKPSKQ